MEVLLATLLIAGMVVTIGSATVILKEIENVSDKVDSLESKFIEVDIAKETIIDEVKDSMAQILVSNSTTRDYIRESKEDIKDAIPKGIMKFLYDPFVGRNRQ